MRKIKDVDNYLPPKDWMVSTFSLFLTSEPKTTLPEPTLAEQSGSPSELPAESIEGASSGTGTAVEEAPAPIPKKKRKKKPKRQPRYHVILWDDDDHSYDYVIAMMIQLFGHAPEKGFEIAKQVDTSGKAICLTTTLEHAELKRDQIHAFGKDEAIARCQGSMQASIEAEG